ncbi:MAG: hypothetical protein WC523_04195 [Patescibacteria group bacterium]
MADNTSTAKNRKQNHNKSGKALAKKQAKREAAVARKETRDKKTAAQQLAELDMMFGKGLGAVKERARLAKKEAKPEAKPEVIEEKSNA